MSESEPRIGRDLPAVAMQQKIEARALVVRGRVQGVGFRPFVHRLATGLQLTGDVKNLSGQVLIHAEGSTSKLAEFEIALIRDAPPLSRPVLASALGVRVVGYDSFRIGLSEASGAADIHIPPDQSMCPDCAAELVDPANRRYRYPFINCTACGPRYTIIEALPYDRAATSMARFDMCPACRTQYEDPADRRFHAEPVACADCGPSLTFGTARHDTADVHGNDAALAAAVAALRHGSIVAVRGIGGYHLVCAAADDRAVGRLRARKRRPEKPLAVMFPLVGADGLDGVRRSVVLDDAAGARLLDPVRPIVIVPRRDDCPLSVLLAPGLGELGAFLPYSPLHQLLLDAFGAPLVATSGNISGEPVITSREEAEQRLGRIADSFLHHDRDIVRPADDPVLRQIAGRMRPVRLGRGSAPLEIPLPCVLDQPVLAIGGQDKVTVTLGIGDRGIVSPHIGDLSTPRAFDQMLRLAADLPRLYRAEPAAIACDLHPGFTGTQWARRQGIPVIAVQHHEAHASALAAEHPDVARWLVFAWDGVGYGGDGTLWGGEALLGRPGHWRRVASFRRFRPPGGDLAAHAPWRSAAALMWEAGCDYAPPPTIAAGNMIRKAWQAQLNAPPTSAVGRLFDAAAALVGAVTETSFEGQGAMQLEHLASGFRERELPAPVALALTADENGLLRCDWSALIPALVDSSSSAAARAMRFHVTMREALVAQVAAIGASDTFDAIGLTGGVFQNRILAESVIARLRAMGHRVELPALTPVNDGGLAFGQLVEAAARRAGTPLQNGMGQTT